MIKGPNIGIYVESSVILENSLIIILKFKKKQSMDKGLIQSMKKVASLEEMSL